MTGISPQWHPSMSACGFAIDQDGRIMLSDADIERIAHRIVDLLHRPARNPDSVAATDQGVVVDLSHWLGRADVAKRLDVSPARVAQLAAEGRIEYVMTSLGKLFNPTSVEALEKARASKSANSNGHEVKDLVAV